MTLCKNLDCAFEGDEGDVGGRMAAAHCSVRYSPLPYICDLAHFPVLSLHNGRANAQVSRINERVEIVTDRIKL